MQIQAYPYPLKSQTFFVFARENCLSYIVKRPNNDGERKDEKCYNASPDAKAGANLYVATLRLGFYELVEKLLLPLVLEGAAIHEKKYFR
jgi:hypothetical protein